MLLKFLETNWLLSNMLSLIRLLKSPKDNKLTIFLSVAAMMAHVFDELIGSPMVSNYLAIVANRFISSLATSFAKPQPCERPHRAPGVRIYTKYWQRASYSCPFTLTILLLQSDYLPTNLPFFYTRIEEYIVPTLD